MCGKESFLITADVEGVDLKVCKVCSKYGEVQSSGSFSKRKPFFKKKFQRQEGPVYKVVRNYSALIRSAREAKEMSQKDFAKFLNERESVIAKWESGALKPRNDVAKRLEKVLNLTLLEKESKDDSKEVKMKKVKSEFTLGDFIKVRKRNK